ncbi:MAG: Membrane protein insertase YidC [Chlamydiae bacterium]|nr:Membrane protein insertase YidC [Chlamydiota bacterium]
MTIALLAINTFFSYWDQQKSQEWVDQQKAKQEKAKTELLSVIDEKTVPIQSLPVVQVDDSSVYGVLLNNQLILIKDEHKLPSSVKVKGKEYTLQEQPDLPDSPALYTSGPVKPLETKFLPNFGSFDLQLVFLSKERAPASALGEYRNSYVSLPIDTLAKDFPEEYGERAPKGTAIALLKMDNRYIAVGVYNSEQKLLVPLSEFSNLSQNLKVIQPKEVFDSTDGEEQFYVLENDFQQLVFSNRGGALAEINLPFQSSVNKNSFVKEIGFDRDMVEQNPQNAVFPSRGYYAMNDKGEKKFFESGQLGGYYPLIRRNLIEKPPYESKIVPPEYYALNVVSEYPEVANLIYKVTYFDKQKIVFEAKQPHRRITKTFSIAQETADEPYVLDLTLEIEGDSRGLWITSGIPEVEWINGGIAPALKYRVTHSEGKSVVESISLPDPIVVNSTQLDWTTNSNGFFGTIVDPLTPIDPGFRAEKVSGLTVPSRLVEIDQEWDRFNPENMPGYLLLSPLNKKGGVMKFRIVAGPFATDVLKTIDATFSDPTTGYNPDYISSQTYHGWFKFITQPFSKFMLIILNMFYSYTGSWGFSIILLTLSLRFMLYPLTAWSFKSTRKMQEISPKLKEIQEKYKKDPKKLQVEMSNLYREAGVNPIGGCLPLFIQIPFLMGIFDLLKTTFELRGAGFIPGWIDNLAAPDVLFTWDYPLIFFGTEFHLLPIFMGLAMLAQTKISARTQDPSKMSDQERQMQGMGNIMAAVFAVFLYNAPSGLCIYWIFSTLFGVAQQKWNLYKYSNPKVAVQEVEIKGETRKGKRRKR